VTAPFRAPLPGEPWWRDAVIYQVYPRSFADSGGDGIGDLRGVLIRLDHLVDLGVDAVWLSPFYPSPQVDNGYDISDYRGVDPVFGTLDDLDALIAALHARGIRLVIDVVVNHTSDQHPWFQASRSDREDLRRGWYYWRDGRDGKPPNNWGSLFSGPAWELDPATGQYYLHTFAAGQPDLDWQHGGMRSAVHDMLRWWLDRGVDGFRLDVISMIGKDPTLPDGPVPEGAQYAAPSMGFAPSLHEHLQELHREVLAGRDLVTIGETPGASIEQARLIADPRRRELDMVFDFAHVSLDHGASKWDHVAVPLPTLKGCLAAWQQGLADHGWNSLYWDNHDQPRVVSRFGDDGAHRVASAKTLATVLHLHRGTPFVYQGEEIGMTSAHFTALEQYRDLESRGAAADLRATGHDEAAVLSALAAASRDNARTPVQWDDGPQAGFTTGTPWISVNPNAAEINVAAQRGEPHSVLAHYRRLIALRHDEPALALGSFALLLPDHDQLWVIVRRHGDVELLVVANCSAQAVTLPAELRPRPGDELLLDLAGGAPDALGPWHSRVHRRRRGAGSAAT